MKPVPSFRPRLQRPSPAAPAAAAVFALALALAPAAGADTACYDVSCATTCTPAARTHAMNPTK